MIVRIEGRKQRLVEKHLQRPLTIQETVFTTLSMPLGLVEYRTFFMCCMMSKDMVYRQKFSTKSLNWRKYLVDGGENWLMVWLVGEITGRIRAGRGGSSRWSFFSTDDESMDFHGAMDCFQVKVGRKWWPEVSRSVYTGWKNQCIEIGLLLPVMKRNATCFVNPNYFIEDISVKKRKFLEVRLKNNLFFMPIQDEAKSYLMDACIYDEHEKCKSWVELNDMGLKPLFRHYALNSKCSQALFTKKNVSLPVSRLEIA